MNIGPPHISLESQLLTPARLQWVLDAAESTVGDWLRDREIEHFRKGRMIRISPEAVLSFVLAHTVKCKARGAWIGPSRTGHELSQDEVLWGRIERLIGDQVTARIVLAADGADFADKERRVSA